MYLNVKFSGFDRNDHKLFHHQNGVSTDKELSKSWRENRTTIQAYLYRIQTRINRGQMKGAVHLFNTLIVKINAPQWVQMALKAELVNPNAKTKQ